MALTLYGDGTYPADGSATQAPAPTSGTQATYTYSPNGSGGVNYYQVINGQPYATTRELYASGTGQDVGAIENQALSDYQSSQNAPTSGGTPSGGGGVVGGTAAAPDYSQQISQYQNSINNLLPAQLNAGNQSIDNSYQSAIQQLLQGKNIADRNYGTAKQQSATGYVGAKNTIGSQAGEALNGLLRLLGSRGAGLSSASLAARQAVARGAGLQRGDVSNTFGQNNQALDTNYGDYTNNYNQSVTGAGTQRDAAKQALQNQISTSKAGLLQQIASLQSSPANAQPYLDQANAITQQVAGYVPPQVNYNPVAYKAPDLASYTTAPPATASYSNQSGGDYFSPYLQQLLGKKQQQPTFG